MDARAQFVEQARKQARALDRFEAFTADRPFVFDFSTAFRAARGHG
jgi:hypothetical protein